MKAFRWGPGKNTEPLSGRGLSFDQVVVAVEGGGLRDVLAHPDAKRYPNQRAMVVTFKASARATATKDRRVNIRLSSGDLQDIQARALQEGMPYQTLIASILHKYVTGRLQGRDPMVPGGTGTKTVSRRQARKADA